MKLIEILLGNLKFSCHVTATNDRIFIETSELSTAVQIRDRLKSSLASVNAFYANFPFEVRIGDTKLGGPSTPSVNYPDIAPPTNAVEVKQIFSNMFGSAFEDAGFDLNLFFGSQAKIENGVLFSKPAKFAGIEDTWKIFFNWLLLHFGNVDLAALRAAWCGKASLSPKESIQNTATRGLIQQCFGIQKVNGKTIAYFNFKRLYEFLFPPYLTIVLGASTGKYIIEVNKQHFLTYLQQLQQGGFLLNVFRPDKDSLPLVQPLLFGVEEGAVAKQFLYTLIIDRSESIRNFPLLKEYVEDFINLLRAEKPTARLRIVFFETKIGPIKEFYIIEKQAISEFLSGISRGHLTNLFNTVTSELEYSFTQADCQAVLILFTDGRDNIGDSKIFDDKIKAYAKNANFPQFHTFGYGNYDHITLSNLALQTQGSFVDVKNFEQLKMALKLPPRAKKSRILVDLNVLMAEGRTQEYRVPLYPDDQDGGVLELGLFIPLTGSSAAFQISDQDVLVTIPDINQIPLGTTIDKIGVLISEVRYLVGHPTKSREDKLSELRAFSLQLNQLSTQSLAEKEAKQIVMEEIKEYTEDLVGAQNSAGALESIYTKAKIRMNFIGSSRKNTCQVDAQKQPTYANGAKGDYHLDPTIEVIYDCSTRGNSVMQQSIAFQATKVLYQGVSYPLTFFKQSFNKALAYADQKLEYAIEVMTSYAEDVVKSCPSTFNPLFPRCNNANNKFLPASSGITNGDANHALLSPHTPLLK